jgi:hypothetical protein
MAEEEEEDEKGNAGKTPVGDLPTRTKVTCSALGGCQPSPERQH